MTSVEQQLTVLRLWSVTTLIKLALGTSEPLVNWAVGTVAAAGVDKRGLIAKIIEEDGRDAAVKYLRDARWRTTGAAQERGTALHKVAEAIALGAPPPLVDANVLPYVAQFTTWLERHAPRFLMTEAPVYNVALRYAGTLDGVMELAGRNLLYDIKTTEHGPASGKSRPPFPEVALQCCAYSRCPEVGLLSEQRYAGGKRYYMYSASDTHEPLPRIDGAICIVVSPEDCFAVPVRIDDTVWDAWRTVIDCARWTLRGSHDLFGPPLPAPPYETQLEEQLAATLETTS